MRSLNARLSRLEASAAVGGENFRIQRVIMEPGENGPVELGVIERGPGGYMLDDAAASWMATDAESALDDLGLRPEPERWD